MYPFVLAAPVSYTHLDVYKRQPDVFPYHFPPAEASDHHGADALRDVHME